MDKDKAIALGRIGGVWYEVEVAVHNGPDDFDWEELDGAFDDYEHAQSRANDLYYASEGGVRIVRVEDEVGTNLKHEVVWENGQAL